MLGLPPLAIDVHVTLLMQLLELLIKLVRRVDQAPQLLRSIPRPPMHEEPRMRVECSSRTEQCSGYLLQRRRQSRSKELGDLVRGGRGEARANGVDFARDDG